MNESPSPPSPSSERTVSAPRLEVAHVLFMDIVGFSRLPMSGQAAMQVELQRIVQNTQVVQQTRAAKEVILRPTGDGVALVFLKDLLAPIRCALEVDEVLKADSSAIRKRTGADIGLRMGIHTGPVAIVEDINGQSDVSGDGIIIAQRVMDCGDVGHILLSEEFARVLAKIDPWSRYLTDIGICWVKHGVPVHLFNLYGRRNGLRGSHTFGNGNRPQKALRDSATTDAIDREMQINRVRRVAVPVAIVLALLLIGFGLSRVPAKTYQAMGKSIGGFWNTQIMARLFPKPTKPRPKPKPGNNGGKPGGGGNQANRPGGGGGGSTPPDGNGGGSMGGGRVRGGGGGGGSSASRQIEAPDLVGISYEEARRLIRGQRLRIQQSGKSEFNTQYAKGMIYQQEPLGNTPVRPGTTIYVRVSKGDPPETPDPEEAPDGGGGGGGTESGNSGGETSGGDGGTTGGGE